MWAKAEDKRGFDRGEIMDEEQVKSINWSVVGKILKKRIVWIVAVAVVVAIVAGLLFAFVLNDGKDTYSLSFDLRTPGSLGTYPDGTPFSVQSLIFEENLQAVKDAGGEKFADIDLENLPENAFTITDNSVNGEGEAQSYAVRYTITAKSGMFSSYEQGNEFLIALLNNYVNESNSRLADRDYTAWEKTYANATTYDAAISTLRSQYDSVLASYDALISTRAYADHRVDGQTVAQHRADAAADISARLTALSEWQTTDKYVMPGNEIFADSEAKSLMDSYALNSAKIDDLKTQLSDLLKMYGYGEENNGLTSSALDTFESFHSTIASLTQSNTTIANTLGKLGYTLDASGTTWNKADQENYNLAPPEFRTELDAVEDMIKASTEEMKTVEASVYDEFTDVKLMQGRADVAGGGTSPIIVAVLCFVLAAAAMCLIFLLAEYGKVKREVEGAEAAAKAKPEITFTDKNDEKEDLLSEAAATETDEEEK